MTESTIPLSMIAHGRSGDKGNHANVAIIAYTPAGYSWLKEHVTSDKVKRFFANLGVTSVERFELDNLMALQFLMRNALGGGASQSLRSDSQGKTLALALLNMEIPKPENIFDKRRQIES